MLKIYKCINLQKSFLPIGSVRFSACGGCPMFECKRPPSDEEDEFEKLRKREIEKSKPFVFQCKAHKDYRIYRNVFFFVCIPSLIFAYLNIFYLHPEHPKRLKFVKFSHMRIRNTPFPWDPDRTLFHSPKYNALSDGYEEDVPEEDEIDPFDAQKKC